MDEVPIPNNNPIIAKPKEEEPKKTKKHSRIFETFKNFIYMFPLACIISYQLYFLGYRFGEFITFPPSSVITYIFIGSILLMLLVIQIMMRSIIYSVVVGIFFLKGIIDAWFGNVSEPVFSNITGIIEIIKASWERKDIPYQLLVTSSVTGAFAAIIFIQFITSILVKSFFELIFGKNWGDGKLYGYLGAIALILGIYISFNSYHKYSNDNKEKLLWKNFQIYNPIEKFITRTPGNITFNDFYIWVNNGKSILSFDINNGKNYGVKNIESKVVCKGIQKSIYPIVATEDKFICYEETLNNERWIIPYPEKRIEDKNDPKPNIMKLIPLTFNYIKEGELLLAFYDYGIVGLYDIEKGKIIWVDTYDKITKVSRMIPDRFLNDISYIVTNDKLVLACQNGIIKSIDLKTGKVDWIYEHTVSKIGGKAQRGILSDNHNINLIAAFKTGEIVTLSYKDGHIIKKTYNESFIPNKPVWCNDNTVNFITDDGLFYKVELDSNNLFTRLNALPNRADYFPIVQNNENSIYGHRENIYRVNADINSTRLIFSCKNRTFVTNPVFDKKVMYIGTLDGWVFCLHYGSENVKWVGHIDGELMEDSLALTDDKLIVKTKSDSVFVYNKTFFQ